MPAPNLLTLLQIESVIEGGLKTLLTTELASVTGIIITRSRQNVSKDTPRVEIMMTTDGVSLQRGIDSAGNFVLNEWLGDIDFRVVTERKKSGSGNKHDEILGRTREVMLYKSAKFTTSIFPYHQIGVITEGSCTHSSNRDADEDESNLNYKVRINIRPDAWPA